MNAKAELEVTLSLDLYRRLNREARRLGVPLTYLVASVVLDTIEEAEAGAEVASAGPEPYLEPALAG